MRRNIRVVQICNLAQPAPIAGDDLEFHDVGLPSLRRETKIVMDLSEEDIAKEIVEWIRGGAR